MTVLNPKYPRLLSGDTIMDNSLIIRCQFQVESDFLDKKFPQDRFNVVKSPSPYLFFNILYKWIFFFFPFLIIETE